jgi:2-C-methyl-D-erythritol 4-phosphate cytidylyltransferase
VTRKDYVGRAVGSLSRLNLSGIVTLGGEQREDSVLLGLKVIPPSVKYVLIHDAARPLVSPRVIERVLKAAVQSGAVIPVVPVKDTLKVVSNDKVVKTLDRSSLRAVQTPQGFSVVSIKKAFQKIGKRASGLTDDAAVAEAAGMKVRVVDGDGLNFKVTTQEDLRYARELAAKKS